MSETNIGATSTTNLSGNADYSVSPQQTDGPQYGGETFYDDINWSKHLGYYRKIPELRAAIDAKASWTLGQGMKSNPITELALSRLKGIGKDSFLSVLQNLHKVSHIGDGAFAEIVRDEEGMLINLKPLDPGSIRTVANSKGIITRYEQISKGVVNKKFQPENMFHLMRDRIADEIHGTSVIPAVEDVILMRNEAMSDYRKLLHRNVQPLRIWHVDTDDTTKINNFKDSLKSMRDNFEDIVIPKGAVVPELSAVPSNATLNPLPWIQQLNQYFFQAIMVPQIIVGGSQEITEASGKITYLSYENVIKAEMLWIETEVLNQLNLEIDLQFPASLQNELISDTSKEESMQAATPEDTAVQPEQPQQQAAAPVK